MEFFLLEAFLTDLSEIMNEDNTKNLYTTPVGNLFKIFIEKFESVGKVQKIVLQQFITKKGLARN